uniref:Uncharacterized protein n=1 Tax=Caenorhabditis japonica TaxID=281687 RepID=A0A8R1ENF5_CAEJA
MRCLLFILLVLSFEAEAAERNADNVPNPHVGERGGDEGEGQPRRNSPFNVMEIFSNMFSDDRTMINSFFPIRDGGRDGDENQPINEENGRQGDGGLYPLQELKDRASGGSGNK